MSFVSLQVSGLYTLHDAAGIADPGFGGTDFSFAPLPHAEPAKTGTTYPFHTLSPHALFYRLPFKNRSPPNPTIWQRRTPRWWTN